MDEEIAKQPHKRAAVHMLPGVALSPGACLGQLLEDIDDIDSLVVVVRWRGARCSVRHSTMNMEQGALSLVLLQSFMQGWLQRSSVD